MRIGPVPVSSASIVAGLGYTPVNKAGDTAVGILAFSSHVKDTAPVTETTAARTVGDTDNYIIANRAGTVTLTLPAAANYIGRKIFIKTIQAQLVISNASNVVPRNSATAGTAILAAAAGNWAMLVSDGTNWINMAGTP